MRVRSPLEMRTIAMHAFDTQCIPEIRRLLFRFRLDPEYRGSAKRVPMRQFSELCGVSRQTLYDIMHGDRAGLEPHTRDAILGALDLVLNKGLRWRRVVTPAVIERYRRVITPAIVRWAPVMPDGTSPPPLRTRPKIVKHDRAHL